MSEPAPVLNDPFARLDGPLAGTTRLHLEVAENRALTPSMQRVVLSAPELSGFGYRPGQDIMLLVAIDGDRPVRRRYTIRAADPARRRLTLGIVRHDGGGPGEHWVRATRPGGRVEGIGPRGKIFPAPGAAWHLFAGDFSALPAFFAMAESLRAGERARVILEIPGPGDEQDLAALAGVELTWLHRDGRPPGDPSALVDAVARAELPPGAGQVYLAGEAGQVLAMRETLEARGMPPDRVSAKAYWGRGRANASHGEPGKDGR